MKHLISSFVQSRIQCWFGATLAPLYVKRPRLLRHRFLRCGMFVSLANLAGCIQAVPRCGADPHGASSGASCSNGISGPLGEFKELLVSELSQSAWQNCTGRLIDVRSTMAHHGTMPLQSGHLLRIQAWQLRQKKLTAMNQHFFRPRLSA